MELIKVNKIWEDGSHNAFTDLCYWQNKYWVCFRHTNSHIAVASSIYVICSEDGENWQKVSEISEQGVDLRDPKFIDLGQRLGVMTYRFQMSLATGYPLEAVLYDSEDGRVFRAYEFDPVMNLRLWKSCKTSKGYFAASHLQYKEDGEKKVNNVSLYFSNDGYAWKNLSCITEQDFPNETALDVEDNGTVHALVRRDQGDRHAYYYCSKPPYNQWTSIDTGAVHVGGPAMKRFGDRLLVVGRTVVGNEQKTGVFWLEKGILERVLVLPSGKDTSYAGIIDAGDGLSAYISYYSGHEYENGAVARENGQYVDKKQSTAIYFAKIVF